jgi:hypothetical protein
MGAYCDRRQSLRLSKFYSRAVKFPLIEGEHWNCWLLQQLKRWRTPTWLHEVMTLKVEIPPITLYFLYKLNCTVKGLTFKILLALVIPHPIWGIHSKWPNSDHSSALYTVIFVNVWSRGKVINSVIERCRPGVLRLSRWRTTKWNSTISVYHHYLVGN